MGAQPPKGGNGLDFGIAGVAAITVIAYIVGLAARVSPLDNKWIPIQIGRAHV